MMTIREITLICWAVASYIYLGYCWASILRRLGWMKKETPRISFMLIMLFWPVGLMVFEERLAADEDDYND
ncbi:TPA: hypothetical protein ACLH5A_004643 [Yersinia enterocolitica]|nr:MULTISPECIES: hypothetical protein [Yersinia]EKN3736458.1 hypothetical protein [Yersinia enterocolitica]MDR4896035.1 hypothetical protein [Yersinia kristensenii]MDX6734692.1 hypothetical protein [Yersinia kristensenii]HEB2006293.1 hypothetical protein [Yersinia enterocolitica]